MSIKISFIVPAFNESQYIEACLRSIEQLSIQSGLDYEVIVVDNGSTDDTAKKAMAFNVNVFSIERSTVSHARNFAVEKSSKSILAFIDGDVELLPDWFETLKKYYNEFQENPLFVTGHQCIVPDNGSWIEQHWFKNLKDQLLGGANIITSRKAFYEIGGFNETLKTGEDYDFCIRCIANEFHYFTDPGFKAIHLGFPHTLKDFLRREYWHGEGDFNSIHHFLRSPVAIIAVGFFCLASIALFAGIFGYTKIVLFCLTLILIINEAITLKRFHKCGLKTIVVNSFLNLGYFVARIASLYRAVRNRKVKH
jgi:glycosyltransferase involved in cell wall biosynthesis